MPQDLTSEWKQMPQTPGYKFYELTGAAKEIAKSAFNGTQINLTAIQSTGLCHPEIQIYLEEDEKFVAYLIYPTLYKSGFSPDAIYACVPVGYKSAHTPVEAAIEITDQKGIDVLMQILFANDHSTPQKIEIHERRLVNLPEDFSPRTHLFFPSPGFA